MIWSLSFATFIGQIISGILVLSLTFVFFVPKKQTVIHSLVRIVGENYVSLVFLIATIATLGSLFLSEVARFAPCRLCWYQRIAMYPIALIGAVAFFLNDRNVVRYVFPLSVIGFGIAMYHCFMQLFPNVLECSEETAKCSAVQFAEFGYITIPVMAATAFLLIILFSLSTLIIRKK